MAQVSFQQIRETKIKQIMTSHQNKEEIRIPIKVIPRTFFQNQAQNKFLDSDDEFQIDFDSKHQQVSRNPLFDFAFNPSEKKFGEFAIISGLPGCGKSTIMKRIEEIAWIESKYTQHLSIPIRIQIKSSMVSEQCYENQISEYLNLDLEQYKQFIDSAQKAELRLLFLIDTDIEMTPDQFYKNLNILSTFKTYLKNHKVIFCLDYYNLQEIKKYKQEQLNFINYEVQLFSDQQIEFFFNSYHKQVVQQKVEDFIKNYFLIQSFSQYQDQILAITENLIEMKINNNNESLHQNIIIQQLKRFECKNYPIETNQFELIFQQLKFLVNQLQDYKQLNVLFNHFQIEILLKIPKILKHLLQILIEEQIPQNLSHLNFFEKILLNFQNMESKQFQIVLDSVEIFDFINKFIDKMSSDSILNTYVVLRSLAQNPLQNTQYLSLIILNSGIIDYLTANFIYQKILNFKDEKQDNFIENQRQITDQDELFFNEFDINQLEYCKQIQKEGLFKRVDLSKQNYKGVVEMLKQKCWKNKQIIQQLLNIIKASSLIDDFQQEAGNAFTILCELKGIIRNENFSYIRLKNSILNGTSFYQCNFSCSEMENVSIIRSQFVGCSLDIVRWNNMKNFIVIKFENDKFLNFKLYNQQNEKINVPSFSKDFFAQIMDNKKGISNDFFNKQMSECQNERSKFNQVSISPDSKYLISCRGQNLKLFQLTTKKFSRMKINCQQLSDIRIFNNEQFSLRSNNNCLRIFNIKNLKLLRKYKTEQQSSFAISLDCQTVVIGEKSKLLNIMSLKTFKIKFRLEGSAPMQFLVKSSLLAFINKCNQICIYDIKIQFEKMVLQLQNQKPQAISFSPDNQIVAAIYCNDEYIYFQSLHNGEQLYKFYFGEVHWISFYNQKFAFGNTFSTQLLDIESLKTASKLNNSKGEFTSLSLQGNYLAAGCKDHSIFLWDLEIGKVVGKLKAHQDSVLTVSFTFDGKLLASGSQDNSICVWEIESRNLKFKLQGHTREINSVIFSTDGKLLASGSSDKTARLWNMQTGSMIKTFNYPTLISSISFIKNDKILLVGGFDGSIFSINIESENFTEIVRITRAIQSILPTNDPSVMIFSTYSYLILWDLENNSVLDEKKTKINSITSKDQFIITVHQNEIMIWQIIQNKLQLIDNIENKNYYFNSITFYPNQNAFITACKQNLNIQLWDFKVNLKKYQGSQETYFDQHSKVNPEPVVQSYQQDIIASGHEDGSIFLWYVKTGQLLLKLEGHKQKISCLHFSPTQAILISGSAGTTVIVWDTVKGSMISRLEDHKNSITALIFSPNGQLIASGDDDGVVILWQADKLSKLMKFTRHKCSILDLDFSPNSKILVSLDDAQSIIYFLNVLKKEIIYKINNYDYFWIQFLTNSKVLVQSLKNTFTYNIKTRKIVNNTIWQSNRYYNGKFCKKNKILALLEADKLYVYDLKNTPIQFEEEYKLTHLYQNNLSADGRMLYRSQINKIEIVHFEPEKNLKYLLYKPGQIYGSVGFLGYAKIYATKDIFNTLTLKDTIRQKKLYQIKDYEGFPISVDQYQHFLVLSNWDNTIQLWNTETNTLINRIEHLQGQVNQIKFLSDGKLIACATFDLKLLLMETNTLKLIQSFELPNRSSPQFCAIQSFHLSKDEKYLTCEFSDYSIYSFCLKNSKCCCKSSKESRIFSVLPYNNTFDLNLLSIVDAKIYNKYGVNIIEQECNI